MRRRGHNQERDRERLDQLAEEAADVLHELTKVVAELTGLLDQGAT